jgi:hypothetical protein
MKRVCLVLVLGCGSSKPATTPGSGSVVVPTGPVTSCDSAKAKVEALYRAEAQAKESKRVDEAVADNTQMVLADCAKQPNTAVPCLAKVQTVAELEKDCLIPLDPEGTEGER